MLKLLMIALISFQVQAYSSFETTLMYRCNNAALAMGGYDEYYVNISMNTEVVSSEDQKDFLEFVESSLKVKSITERQQFLTYVVRAADLNQWVEVAISLEAYLELEGISGNCHLDL